MNGKYLGTDGQSLVDSIIIISLEGFLPLILMDRGDGSTLGEPVNLSAAKGILFPPHKVP